MAWLREVKSGVRIAFSIVGAILVVGILGRGMLLVEGEAQNRAFSVGLVSIVLAVGIMWATVARWAKWFFAACCGNTLRVLIMAMLGRTTSIPSIAAPRTWFLALAGIFAIMSLLTHKFWDRRPDRVESICLVIATTAIVHAILAATPWWSVAIAVLSLALPHATRGTGRRGFAFFGR